MKTQSRIEQWKDIPGYEGKYQASNMGRIRSLMIINRLVAEQRKEPLVLKQAVMRNGYLRASLSKNGRTRHISVHRLILLAFVGEAPAGYEAAHLDGTRTNNNADNLAWTTRKVNHSHKYLHGTAQVGEKANSSKLTTAEILEMRRLHAAGMRPSQIAKTSRVTRNIVSDILLGKRWKHLL